MSALGHKRTYAVQKVMSALAPTATAKAHAAMVMSALLPKADMCSALAHVRFGPIADIGGISKRGLGGGERPFLAANWRGSDAQKIGFKPQVAEAKAGAYPSKRRGDQSALGFRNICRGHKVGSARCHRALALSHSFRKSKRVKVWDQSLTKHGRQKNEYQRTDH